MEEKTVRKIMTERVISVTTTTSLLEIKQIFETNRFHHLPVIGEDNRVIGMISRLDYHLVLDHFTIFKIEKAERSNEQFLGALIAKDIMTTPVVSIGSNDLISTAAEVFIENLFHALPVIEDGKLIGILTTIDLLKYYTQISDQMMVPAS